MGAGTNHLPRIRGRVVAARGRWVGPSVFLPRSEWVIVPMSDTSSVGDPHSRTWLGLSWSAWMPLMAAHPLALAQLPSAPGLYRIRRAELPGEVLWTGWARTGVREVVERLARQVHLPLEPYDDPSGPALSLWKARVDASASFQVSGAPVDLRGEVAATIVHEVANWARNKTVPRNDE